ncbi:MAG: hypothetical protein AAFZ18_08220 [Myxococcota bacterium]
MKTYALIAGLLAVGALALWWGTRPEPSAPGVGEGPSPAVSRPSPLGSGAQPGAPVGTGLDSGSTAGRRGREGRAFDPDAPESLNPAREGEAAGASPASTSLGTPRPEGVLSDGARRDGEGLTEVLHPDGTVTLDLQGRFRSLPVAVQDEDGNVRIEER